MLAFGLKNLRRLDFEKPVDLKPITILVGRNSSGKSTFLRTFPLIRQSVTTRTSSPVLWYGDLVDFGDFDGAVYNNDTKLPITFTFSLDKVSPRSFYPGADSSIQFEDKDYYDFTVAASIIKDKTGSRLSSLKLTEQSNKVSYELTLGDKRRITALSIDGQDATKDIGLQQLILSDDSMFPTIYFVSPRSENKPTDNRIFGTDSLTNSNPVKDAIAKIIKPHIDPRTKDEKLSAIVESFRKQSIVNESTLLAVAKRSDNQSIIKFFEEIQKGLRKNEYQSIRRLLLILLLPRLFSAASDPIESRLGSVLYIGPARARSDRYYRYQDLSVSEIDPDGKNFAMFLNSLSESRMESFSNWVKDLFGYGVEVNRTLGHITISLKYDENTVNIVDTGYGISQILPVLGQVWWANNRPQGATRFRSRGAPLLAIEQPELHLHPAHQALLADAFVSGFKFRGDRDSELGTHFLIETHSEALINRLGALILEGKLSQENVQILIFETNGTKTDVRTAIFDEEGQLIGWPYGFFQPDA